MKTRNNIKITAHLLVPMPANANNCGEDGRPKSVHVGGVLRRATSAQAKNRAVREAMAAIEDDDTVRTRKGIETYFYQPLVDAGLSEKKAKAAATKVRKSLCGGSKSKGGIDPNSVHLYKPGEIHGMRKLAAALIEHHESEGKWRTVEKDDLLNLRFEGTKSLEMALGGRFVAGDNTQSMDSARQVAVSFSVNRPHFAVDFASTVDDLNTRGDSGAAHCATQPYAATVDYQYVTIDWYTLLNNLQGDVERAKKAVRNYLHMFATVNPSGNSTRFAAHTRAAYMRVEKGTAQPYSLASAFLDPIEPPEVERKAIKALRDHAHQLRKAYDMPGQHNEAREMIVAAGEGTLSELLDFCVEGLPTLDEMS